MKQSAKTSAKTSAKITVSTLAATTVLGLAACSTGGSGDTVISYNSPEQWANWGAVLDAFTEETGIDAPSDDKNSGQVMAALEAEKSSPAADVAYYGVTFGPAAQEAGLVEPWDNDKLDDIPADLKAEDNSWFTVHEGAVAILVNTDAIGDAPVPQCWDDLTKPEYKGLVSFLDPTNAAVGQSVITAVNLAKGGDLDNWDPAMEWVNDLKHGGDLKLPTETATSQLAQGEIPILIDADFNGYQTAQEQDAPIEVVLPCEGTISTPYVMSKVKDAPNPENADAFLDYVLGDDAQKLFAESYLRPVRDVEVSDEVAEVMRPDEEYEERLIEVDFAEMTESVDSLKAAWDAEGAN
ncbi:MAG: extracellular solute-binding protein [Candidatus Corynebacterium faecigallinarum]